MTLNFVDALDAIIAVETVGTLGVTARAATHGIEITGSGFEVAVLAEVKEAAGAYTPYQQYYDAASKPPSPPPVTVSFGGVPPKTFEPAPMMVAVFNNVPMAVLAWSPISDPSLI